MGEVISQPSLDLMRVNVTLLVLTGSENGPPGANTEITTFTTAWFPVTVVDPNDAFQEETLFGRRLTN